MNSALLMATLNMRGNVPGRISSGCSEWNGWVSAFCRVHSLLEFGIDGYFAEETTYARLQNPPPAIVAAPGNPTPAQSAAALGLYAWPSSSNLGEFPAGGNMVTSIEELPACFEKQICSVGSFIYSQQDSWMRANHHLYFTDGTVGGTAAKAIVAHGFGPPELHIPREQGTGHPCVHRPRPSN